MSCNTPCKRPTKPYGRRHAWRWALAVWLACTLPAAAALPPAVQQSLPEARLAGRGEMRWLGFTLYGAQLWTRAASLTPQSWPHTPFALELRYATGIPGHTLAARSTQEITRLGWGDAARRQRWHDAMLRLFPNVSRGDRLTGVHTPGQGARFFFNDRPLGSIDDPDFSQAFFAIWLDPRTVAPELRHALLHGSAP